MNKEEETKKVAYFIWENEGRPRGKDVEHYFKAEHIIAEREATQIAQLPREPQASKAPTVPTRRGTRKRKSG
ncbi:MAG: DUF2934 domain-containing protein [Chloroflexi bacterium]|nr:DUF2934 domain-containing protein [Chloroflexota bacterium]